MSRTYTEENVSHMTPITYKVPHFVCDKCGKLLDHDDMSGELFPNEVILLLNDGECVSSRIRRDYCPECLALIWDKICELINADPDAEINDFEDDLS